MRLLILFGPPAVGKATVGKLVEDKTDFKLFHNHMVMDGVIGIFGAGSPQDERLSRLFRGKVIEEAADAGMDLIFTYAWSFDRDKGKNNIDAYKEIYESRGGEVLFIELTAPLETRLARADNPDRKQNKPNAPRSERVAHLHEVLDHKTPSPFYYPDVHHVIDTTHKSANEVADAVVAILNATKK